MSSRLKIAFVVVDDRFATPSPMPSFGAAPSAVIQGFSELPDSIEVHVICCTMGQPANPEKIADNIYFHAVDVPKSGFLRTLHLGCYRAIKPIIEQIRPDVVHAQGTERWCAWVTSFLPYLKVLTIHGNLPVYDREIRPKPRAYWKLQTLLHKLCVGRFDGVFCNSRHTLENVRKATRRTWEVPNALRSEFFQPPTSHRTAPVPVLLNVGVFHPNKRQREVLQIAGRLHSDGHRFKLRIIGLQSDSDYCLECKELVAQGEAAGFIEYAGVISAADMVNEMDRAHGMIHFPVQESFGLVVAEAMARGLKLFASSVGGIVDIVGDSTRAELFDLNDDLGLTTSIGVWLKSGAQRDLSAAADIAGRYSPEVIARRHIEIYRELLGQA